MALIKHIIQLRDDSISSLNASHNYYTHTKSVWQLIQRMERKGHKFTIRNQATNNTVDQTELSGLAQGYITDFLASATFQHFVSVFEQFVNDLLCLWLTEYPDNLSRSKLEFQTVLDSSDRDALVGIIVQKHVHKLTYERLADWFKYLEGIAKLGCPNQDQIEQLSEVKASRDVLVHNNGITNSIYVDKSYGRARYPEGDKLELPEPYHLASWELIKQVVNDVANAVIKKFESREAKEN